MTSITYRFCDEFSQANDLDYAGPCKARLIAIAKIPMQLITTTLDTLIGTPKLFESFVPFADVDYCAFKTIRHLSPLQRIVSNLFRRIIEILNPKAEWTYDDNYNFRWNIYTKIFEDQKDEGDDKDESDDLVKFRNFHGFDGITSGYCLCKVGQLVNYCNNSSNKFVKHVGTRFSLLIMAIVAVFCRAIDFVIGALATAGSILLLGRAKRLNHIACKGLAVLSVITDIYMCILYMIKPLPKRPDPVPIRHPSPHPCGTEIVYPPENNLISENHNHNGASAIAVDPLTIFSNMNAAASHESQHDDLP